MGLRMPLPATSSSSSSAAATTLPTVGSAQGTAGESPVGLSLKLIAGAARGRAREPPPSVPHRSHRPLPVTRPAEADPPATEVVVAAARRQPRRPHPTARGE
ncbi:Os07g0421450 [Oryza sativa Japonica Group]|nr:Os07g0421450 [Oryza sativa Japonica Group]